MGIEMNAGASFAEEDVVELLSENMAGKILRKKFFSINYQIAYFINCLLFNISVIQSALYYHK